MATFTTKSWKINSWFGDFQFKAKRVSLFFLAFIWLSAFNHPNKLTSAQNETATFVAFDGCKDNLLLNGSFESNLFGWASDPSTNIGRASSYASDGGFHIWIQPISGTAETYQYVNITEGVDLTLQFAAGVHDSSGNQKVGFQYLDITGNILLTQELNIDNDLDTNPRLQEYTLTGIAPVGAVEIKVYGVTDSGYLRIDGVCLLPTPDPLATPPSCLLNNSSFENGLTNWSTTTGTNTNISSDYAVDGSQNTSISPSALSNDSKIFQNMPASAGQTYFLSVWAGAYSTSNTHQVGFQFLDAFGNVIATYQNEVDNDPRNGNGLAEYTISGTAPLGTTQVSVYGYSSESYLSIDNACLSIDETADCNITFINNACGILRLAQNVNGFYVYQENLPIGASTTQSTSEGEQWVLQYLDGTTVAAYIAGCGETQTITDDCFNNTINPTCSFSINLVGNTTTCPDNPTTLIAQVNGAPTCGNANNPVTYQWSTGSTDFSIFPSIAGIYSVTVTDCNGCAQEKSITVNNGNCNPGCSLSVNAGPDQTVCDQNVTLTANISGNVPCTTTNLCDLTANATELVRWSMDGCDPAGDPGAEDCTTVNPTIISLGGCATVLATAPCNPPQYDFSCNGGFAGGGGICFPADSRTYYERNNNDNTVSFEVTIAPNGSERAALTGISFYHATGIITQSGGVFDEAQKLGLRVLKNGQEIYYEDNIALSTSWRQKSITFSGADFEVNSTTTFQIEMMGYDPLTQSDLPSTWDMDELKIYGGCCANTNTTFNEVFYNWSTGESTESILATTSGIYTVTVADCNGCLAIDEVVFNKSTTPFATNDQIETCCTEFIIGNVNENDTGLDNPVYMITQPPINGTIAMESDGTFFYENSTNCASDQFTYKVCNDGNTGVDACCSEATMSLNILPEPVININIDNPTICFGEKANISVSASGGSAGYTFEWDNNLGSGTSFEVMPATTTTYRVTVIDANICVSIDSVTVISESCKYDLALINTLSAGQASTVSLGENVSYDITVTNQGDVPSLLYDVTTQIPAGMSFVSASDGGTENGGIITWTDLSNLDPTETKVLTILLRVDDATQSDYRIWSEISDDSADAYNTTDEDSTPDANVGYDNSAGVAGISPNDAFVNHNDISLDEPANDEDDNDFEDITLNLEYDLALIKELGNGQPTIVNIGDQVLYNITIANQGNVPSNSYTVTDQVPAGMSYVTSSDGGTASANVVTWANLPNLLPGATKTIVLTLRVDDATQSDYRNWAEISDDSSEDYGTTDEDSTPDTNVGDDNTVGLGTNPNDPFDNHNDITLDEPAGDEDDNDFEDVTLTVQYDLALIKTLGNGQPNTVELGNNVVYDISITNQGNVPSNDYTVTDQIPAGMSFVSASDAGTESGGIVTWSSLPNLNPGQTKTVALVLRVDQAIQGNYRNVAEISEDSAVDYNTTDEDSTPDANLDNDPTINHNDITLDDLPNDEDDNDFEEVSLSINYDLALVKTLGSGQSATVGLGDNVAYNITIANQGNVPSNNYTVADQIPAGMSFVSASDAGTENGGLVTWSNLPNLAPGQLQTLTIILRVEDATLSDYRNWAEITEDSANEYGTTDEDSTPDSNIGNDNTTGLGTDPNDPFNNHNDISLDEPANDEDDNDFEDISLEVNYDLALIKTLGAGQSTSVGLGDNITYDITIANQGNVPSSDYTVTDQIPAGMSFVSASDAGIENGGIVTWAGLPNLNPGQIRVLTIILRIDDATQSDYRNWAEISDDSSEDYGTTDEDSTPDTNVGNDNTSGFGTAPNDLSDNHNDITLDDPANDEDDNDFEDVSLNVNYDLALIKTLGVGQSTSVGLGDNIIYEITIANQGNVPSNAYNVTDQIPAGMSFVSASDAGISNSGIVTWTGLPNLNPGQTKTLVLILRVDDASQSDYRNWAEISDDSSEDYGTTDEDSTPDSNAGNDNTSGFGTAPNDLADNHNDISLDEPANDEDDNDFEDISLEVNYDLALVKSLASGQSNMVNINDLVAYNITVANQGNVPSNAYSVIDQIPAGMTFISASDAGVLNGSTVNWSNLPNLNPGDTKVLALILQVTDAAQSDYRNWAEISDDSSEDYGTTDEDSTPDSNVGDDNTNGFGDNPNDAVVETDDITQDMIPGDEDDNDFEDVSLIIQYDLALIKTLAAGQASSVTVGENVNYTITVSNQGNVPSNTYTVIDAIPTGMSFVSASNGGIASGSTVTWSNLPNLDPGTSTQLAITLRLDDATIGSYVNRAEISDDSSEDYNTTDEDSSPDGDVNNDPVVNHNDPNADTVNGDEDDNDLEEIQVGVEYDLALIKTLSSGQSGIAGQGDNVSYDITIANQGNVESLTYSVTDQIPAGMSFVSASDGGTLSGGLVTWTNLSNLPAGSIKTLTLVLRVTEVTQGPFRNWAEISDDSSEDYSTTDDDSSPDSNVGNDNSSGTGTNPNDPFTNHNDITLDNPAGDEDDNDYEDVQAQVQYDLALIKILESGQAATVQLGDFVTYNILVANQGNVPSNTYTVTDQIPAGMSVMTASDGGISNGSTVTWTLPDLAPGATKTISLTLQVNSAAEGDYRNWAEISDDSSEDYGTTDEDSTPDGNIGNDNSAGFGTDPNDPYTNHNDITLDNPAGDEDDNDYEDIAVNVSYDLALAKSLSFGQSATVNLGDVVSFDITVVNQGNVASNDFSITDYIPAGMQFISASDFGSFAGNTVTWSNLANLAPGQSKTVTVSLRVIDSAQAPFENFAEISEDSAEDYGVTDEDSTPDTNPNNDPVVETDDPTIDEIPGDEDDSDPEVVDVNVNYDLSLAKALADGQSATVTIGEVVNYTITVLNQGNVPSNDYSITDYIPAGMQFVSASDFGSASANTVTWTSLPSLAPNQSATVTLALRVTDVGQAPFENFAEISEDSSEDYETTDEDSTPDTNPTNDPVVETDDPTADQIPGDEDDSDPEVVDVNISYDLSLAKALSPGQAPTVNLGDVVDYTITVVNQGNVPSNGYSVADYIPAGMQFLTASDFGTQVGNAVTWSNLSSLAPGASKTLAVSLIVSDVSQAPFENFAEITDDSSEDYGTTDEDSTPDTNPTNDPVIETDDPTPDTTPGDEDDSDIELVDVNINYDLALVKTLAPTQGSTVSLGEIVNFTIIVNNQGNVPSNDYSVADYIPAGMEFISASDFGSANGGIVTWSSLASLAPGETKSLLVVLRVTDLAQAPFENFAEITDDSAEDYGVTDEDSTPDTNPSNDPIVETDDPTQDNIPGDEDDSDTEQLEVNINYDLALIKTLAPGQAASINIGEVVDYDITIINQGNVASNDYTVTDVIPAGMSFISASDFGTASSNIVTWTALPTLAVGQSKTLTIALRLDDPSLGSYINRAEISDDSSEDYGVTDEDSTPDADVFNDPVVNHNDPNQDDSPGDEDDNDLEEVNVSVNYDLALIKTLSQGQASTVNVGDVVSYTISIANQGNVPSNGYSVIDQIPAGMTYISSSDAGAVSGSAVTWNLPNLSPGQIKTLSIALRVDDPSLAAYRNWAEISSDSAGSYGVSDEDSTPDTNTGNDNMDGTGVNPNDPYTNHNDITLDDSPTDEDDNDYEDIQIQVKYDLALIKTLSQGQVTTVKKGAIVNYDITVANQGNVNSNDYNITDRIPGGMSFVSASDNGVHSNGIVTWSNLANLVPGEIRVFNLTLQVTDITKGDFRNWAEISEDSANDYATTDEDSTPDSDVGSDNGPGLGIGSAPDGTPSIGDEPNDPYTNHNDITLDDPIGDEDDNDYEDISIIVEYDLALIKTLAPGQAATVSQGDIVTYVITITNQGDVPSDEYTVIDQMPAGMSFISASDAGISNGRIITWSDLPNIDPGDSKELNIILQVTDATLDSYINWAEISDDSSENYGTTDEDSTPDNNLTNDDLINHNDITLDDLIGDEDDNDQEAITVQPIYDLALIKTLAADQASSVSVGDFVNYEITIANQGNVPSNNYSVTDQIPTGMGFVSASNLGSINGSQVIWSNLPNINPGETATLSLTLVVLDGLSSDYRNWAEISDDSSEDYGTTDEDSTPDTNVGNDNTVGFGQIPNDPFNDHDNINLDNPNGDEDDNDYEDIQLLPTYDLALVKTLAPNQASTVAVGEVIDYIIIVSNQGTVPSNDYTVIDQIPAGMSFVMASDFGTASGNVVTWSNLPNINPGENKMLSIALRIEDPSFDSYRNIAEIADDSSEDYGVTDEDSTPDTDVTNDEVINHNDPSLDDIPSDEDDHDFEELEIEIVYDLALIKTLSAGQPSAIAVGDRITYDITVTNQGNVSSLGYVIGESIPAGMSFVSATNGGINNGVRVTWTSLPNLSPGASTTVQITLQLDDASLGSYRNYAEIIEDSSEAYDAPDQDSTPDSDPLNDDTVNHNDPLADTVPGDEDDHDYEDLEPQIVYDLALVKTLANGQAAIVSAGDVVDYVITVANQGNVPSGNYSVTDHIPAGMSLVAASNAGIRTGNMVNWTNLTSLAPGQTEVLTIALRIDDISLGDYRNWAEITADGSADYNTTDEDSTPDTNVGDDNTAGFGIAPNDLVDNHNNIALDNPANDEDDNDYEDIQVNVSYDLALIKTLAPNQSANLAAGDQVAYHITVTNQGNVPSNDYTVADVMPAGMTFISASDFGNANGSTVTWTSLPNLNPGESKVLSIVLRMEDTSLSSYQNFAEITDDSSEDFGTTDEDSTPDTNPANDPVVNHNDPTADTVTGDEDDSDYEEVTPIIPTPIYDLALIKTLAAGQAASGINEGDNIRYDIMIINQGNVPSNDYIVTDLIPAGMSFVTASDGGTSIGNTATWVSLPNIDPGQSKVISITLRLDDASLSSYRNIAEITDDSAEDYGVTDKDSNSDNDLTNDLVINHNDPVQDQVVGDEDDNDIEDISPIAPRFNYDLALIKTLAQGEPTALAEGDQVTYNITVTNQGTVASNEYTVIDLFPQGMSVVSASDAGVETGGVVIWDITSSLNPSESKVLSLTLRMDDVTVSNTYRNWAEISEDSASDYGTTDEDSTPDPNPTNDPVVNHDNPTADTVIGDEDDNDYADITPIIPLPVYDLALIKTLSTGQSSVVGEGDMVTYDIIIANQGTVNSLVYDVMDQIPAGMSYVSDSAGGSYDSNDNTVIWFALPFLDPGQTTVIQLTLRVDDISKGNFRNWAEIIGDSASAYNTSDEDSTPDGNIGNDNSAGIGYDPDVGSTINPGEEPNDEFTNHNDITLDDPAGDEDDNDFEDITVEFSYDLALVKTLANGENTTLAEGDQVTFDITILNQGHVPSGTYTVIDQIPAGMSFVSASDGGTINNGIVTWNLPDLAEKTNYTISITLQMEDASFGSYRNYAEISDDSSEDYGVTDEDSTPDSNISNDPVVNHNDLTVDDITGDEDDHDYEEVSSLTQALIIVDCAPDITISCEDSTDPLFTGLTTAIGDCPQGSISVTYLDISSELSGCGGYTGIITREWTITDACGSSIICTQSITIVDETAPIFISCPLDQTVSCDASLDVSVMGMATATDNCSSGNLNMNFSDTNVQIGCGTMTREFTATDACGNTSTCSQMITIIDRIAPSIACPADITVDCTQSYDPSLTGGLATASDNCTTALLVDYTDSNSTIDCQQGGILYRTYVVVDACGNQANCEQTITVFPRVSPPNCDNFSITTSGDITICNGSTAQLNVTGGLAYTWSPPTGLSDPLSSTPAASPTSTTTYTVTAVDQNNCEVQSQVTVTVENDPVVFAGENRIICDGASTQLNATGGVFYAWSPSDGLDNPSSANPIATPSLTTTYTVLATDANGCTGVSSVTISLGKIEILANGGGTICTNLNETTQLGAVGGQSYVWSPTNGLSDPFSANPIASPSVTTTYTVTGTDENGCVGTASVIVIADNNCDVPSGPCDNFAIIDYPDRTICAGNITQLNASGGVLYSWVPTTGLDNPSSPNPIANPIATTTYTVTVISADGCSATDQIRVEVQESISVNAGPDQTYFISCPGDPNLPAQLNATGGIFYIWSPVNGLDNPTIPNPIASPSSPTTYSVTITDQNGCTGVDEVRVEVATPGCLPEDTDGDGIPNEVEVQQGTDPNNPCSNSYSADEWCTLITNNPNSPLALLDCDNGGVINAIECAEGKDPTNTNDDIDAPVDIDSDGDGITNNIEIQQGTDPNNPCSNSYSADELCAFILNNPSSTLANADCDNGGIINIQECVEGNNPLVPQDDNSAPEIDFDGDGITDNIEIQLGTNPNDPCSNNYSAAELCAFISNNPNSPLATADCDNGGVINAIECTEGKNPLVQGDDSLVPNPGNCDGFVIYECPDKRICVGGSTQLVVNGGVSWVWSPAAGLDDPFSDVPKASPNTTTIYTVTATDANGCIKTAEVVVTVQDQLKVYAGEDQTVCNGQGVQLNGQGGIQFEWSPATGLTDPNIANPLATPTVSTTYTVLVTDHTGCTGTASVTISIGSGEANAGADQTICSGESVALNATGGTLYNWQPAMGLSSTSVQNPTANPQTTTTYTVTVTDANGCSGTDQITITVNNSLVAEAGNSVTICSGESTPLNATGGTNYQWSPTNGLSNPNSSNPVANPSSTTTYSVTVSDARGCTASDQTTVNVIEAVGADAGNDRMLCNDGCVQLNAIGGASYSWSPTTGLSNAAINNPMACPTVTTTYSVMVTDVNGCTSTDNVTVSVSDFTALACEDKAICFGETTRILVSAGASYQWSPAATLDNANIAAPMASPVHTTTYFVTVTDENGCTSSDQMTLYVHDTPAVDAGDDISACGNENIQLNAVATGVMSYEWSPAESLSNPFIANPIATPSTTTTYTVMVMDFNGCTSTDQVTFVVDCGITPLCDAFDPIADVELCADNNEIARICLAFTVEELATTYTVSTSTGTITPDHGCDFIPVYAYTYAILPNRGDSGTFTIESWVVNGTNYTGVVSSMAELATWMQAQDPTGNWENIADSFFIQGGDPASTYGDLEIMHEETWIETTLNPSSTGQAQGTLIEVDMAGKDSEILTITHNETGCTDEVTIRKCETTPRCPQDIVANRYEASIAECEELGKVCLPLSLDQMLDFDLLVNGVPYEGSLQGCKPINSLAYTYFSIPDQGEKGPYQISSWIINGTRFNGSFNNLEELLTWMNTNDPNGNWVLDITTLSIRGGTTANTYGKLEIIQTYTRSKASLDINKKSSSDGTQIELAAGTYQLKLYNINNGCSDDFEVAISCNGEFAPEAAPDVAQVPRTQSTAIDLVANDTRAEEITLEIIKSPQYGEAIINADNTVSYLAIEGYCNTQTPDRFTYRICNQHGCDEATVEVEVTCPTIKVHSGFSPNNDGINDYLTIEGLENYPSNELIIFNRWGSEIFKQKGYDGQWDGSFNGLPIPDGTYFYVLKNGEGNSQTGYIQLSR